MTTELTALQKKGEAAREGFEIQRKRLDELLPNDMDTSRFINVAMTAYNKMPALLDCTPASRMIVAFETGMLGLEPFVQGQAYWLPFKEKKGTPQERMICQLIIGYRGYILMGRRSGQIDQWVSQTIKEKDEFRYVDHPPDLHHVRGRIEKERGDVIAAYSSVRLFQGEWQPHVMYRDQIDKRMKVSRSHTYSTSPWKLWYEEMCAKTAIRSHAKVLPVAIESNEFKRALDLDNRADMGERQFDDSEVADFQELDETQQVVDEQAEQAEAAE